MGVAGSIKSGDITNDIVVKAVGGQDLRANIYPKSKHGQAVITVNGAQVVYPDFVASNGVIHFVSDVLSIYSGEDHRRGCVFRSKVLHSSHCSHRGGPCLSPVHTWTLYYQTK